MREACAIAAATSDPPRKVSRQGFAIFPKIREIDALLRARPDLLPRVYEVHPELAFWALNGGRPLTLPKKVKGTPYGPGMDLRRELAAPVRLLPDGLIAGAPAAGRGRGRPARCACGVDRGARSRERWRTMPFPTRPAATLTACRSPSGRSAKSLKVRP